MSKKAKKNNKSAEKHYLSAREIRQIAKENSKVMKALEKKKYRRADESEFVTEMKDDSNILEIDNLHTFFFTDQGVVKAVNGVSFNIPLNATVGVVGESGCGKSVTSMSVMRLLQGPQGQIFSGNIRFKARDFKLDENGNPIPLYKKDENGNTVLEDMKDKKGKVIYNDAYRKVRVIFNGDRAECSVVNVPRLPKQVPVQATNESGVLLYEMEDKVYDIAEMPINEIHRIRGRQISMIFQEPMTSLNPVFTIGNQLDEVVFIHTPGATKEMAKRRSLEMLELVGIAAPERVYNSYPHELSGGMRQRVMISMALACDPRLIIADEPTTALDVTIQAQILDLLRDIKDKMDGSIMLITHDLGIIAEMADYVVVMYAGRVIEQGTVSEIFHNPLHPYTIGLQKSKPTMDSDTDTLFNIPGNVPNPVNMPSHCFFKERCSKCTKKCSGDYPDMIQVSPTHFVACHLYGEEEKNG